jgi:hypothetical protein
MRVESQPRTVPMASHAAMLLGWMMRSGFRREARLCDASCALRRLRGNFIPNIQVSWAC